AVDDLFEEGSRAEGRHSGLLHPHGLTGARIPRCSGCPVAFLEDTETTDGDLLALLHVAHDEVNHAVDRIGRGLLLAESRAERLDQLGLVHFSPFARKHLSRDPFGSTKTKL